jgi:hypothetical protein
MRRFLIVANQTLGGDHLANAVERHLRAGPCSFHVVVPATPPKGSWTYTDGQARAIATERMEAAIVRFTQLGAQCDGEVGDPRPLDAIRDVLRQGRFDGIIVSTLPHDRSSWLKMDLPARVRTEFGIPLTHLVGDGDGLVPGRRHRGPTSRSKGPIRAA